MCPRNYVSDVIMPPIGLLMGGVNFTDLKVTLKPGHIDAAGKAIEAVTLNYGRFLQTTVDFVIIAFAIFIMIKAMNAMKKKEDAAPSTPPQASKEEVLLGEIRDILKRK